MRAHYAVRQLYATAFLFLAPFLIAAQFYMHGVSLKWLAAGFAVLLVLTIYGYNVGSHYAFAHRTFKFSRPVELALIYTSVISACASPVSWAAHHHAHHRYTETEHDPHSPTVMGWRALLATNYKTAKADPMLVRHLLRDPAQMFADGDFGFWSITLSWPVIVGIIGGVNGLIYLWLIPVWYVLAVAIAFVFSHTGPHDEQSRTRAVNSRLLGVLSLGDGNHLEHHRNMRSCGRGTRFFASLIGA